MSWDNNIQSNPEKFGLEILKTVEAGRDYEFDTLILFKDVENSDLNPTFGKVLQGEDSGCSCPCPFENVKKKDLVEATENTINTWFESRLQCHETTVEEKMECLRLIKEGS